MQVIISIYMPFYDKSNSQQTFLLNETIEVFQSIFDKYAPTSTVPIKFLGDFNCRLPTCTRLSKLWYKSKVFNNHSCILYDFMASNDLIAAHLVNKQSVNYTYFCHTNGNYSWIDHALCASSDADKVNCVIIPEEHNNCSDHLPIRLQFNMTCNPIGTVSNSRDGLDINVQPNWSNDTRNDTYCSILAGKLANIL